MGRPKRLIAPQERRAIITMAAAGATRQQMKAELGVSMRVLSAVLRPLGGVIRMEWRTEPHGCRLSLAEREEIFFGLGANESLRRIAARLARAPSSICREVGANGGKRRYNPYAAERRAQHNARRPKPLKLHAHPALWARVSSGLEALWSPQQIAARLRAEFGSDTRMTISHETIYKSIYVQGRGELRRELARCLRSGRAARRPRGRLERRGRLPDMLMISDRPAEVADRAVPGHWEGDLIMGTRGTSAIGTLVERSTRFVMLLHLPSDHGAEALRRALVAKIT